VQGSHCRWNDIACSGTNRNVVMKKEIRVEGAKFGRRSHFFGEGPTGSVPSWDDVGWSLVIGHWSFVDFGKRSFQQCVPKRSLGTRW